jgi:hypothetical protein
MCSRPRAVSAIRYFASYASCSRRSSNFFIGSIASSTRFALAGSPPPPSRLPSFFGMICHDSPNLSLSQPHWLGDPPSAVSLSHRVSISCCESHPTKERDRLVELEKRPCVERHELLAFELVLDRHHLSVCAVNGQHPRPREDGRVVVHRLFGLRVEPEKWRDGQHGRLPVEFVGGGRSPPSPVSRSRFWNFYIEPRLTEESTQGVRPRRRQAEGGQRVRSTA